MTSVPYSHDEDPRVVAVYEVIATDDDVGYEKIDLARRIVEALDALESPGVGDRLMESNARDLSPWKLADS